MLPNTRAAIQNIATLTRHSNTSDNLEEEEEEEQHLYRAPTLEINKYKLKEYRDMYLNSHTHSFNATESSSSINSRTSLNIYDTDRYIHTDMGTEYTYPFIDELSKTIPTSAFNSNKSYDVNVCVYRIFNSGGNTVPFLQFKLLKRPSAKEMTFPTFKYKKMDGDADTSEPDNVCLSQGNSSITRWFKIHSKDIKFKGFIKTGDDATACYLVYEETITKERYKTLIQTELKNIKSTENWWWACTDEIFNKGMVLTHPVASVVKGLLTMAPGIMFLYNKNGFTYETPTILYTGFTEGSSLEEIRLLGPRKLTDDNNITNPNIKHINVNDHRMYGAQYYFYELDHVFRNACYAYDNAKHKYKKISEPHIFRYAVFLGITKVTLFDTDNTTTHVSINGAQSFRETKWSMEGYESIFHGKYNAAGRQYELSPVFSVFDNTQFVALSCHEVDASTVPSEFSDTIFKTVKLI